MRKLKADLDRLKAILEEKNPGGAEALRFAEVNDLWGMPSEPFSAVIRRISCSTIRTACT